MVGAQLSLFEGPYAAPAARRIVARPGREGFAVEVPWTFLRVSVVRRPTYLALQHEGHEVRGFGFCDVRGLLAALGRTLAPHKRSDPRAIKFYRWRERVTARALARPVAAAVRRVAADVDPAVLAVHRQAFRTLARVPEPLLAPEIYTDPWLVRDLARYRAAVIAAAGLESLVMRWLARNAPDRRPTGLEPLQHWRALFSITGQPYRTLDRTLMNLPAGVPAAAVAGLADVRLPRPLLARAEVAVVGLWAAQRHARGEYGDRGGDLARHDRPFLFATADQVREAVRRVGAHLREPLSWRRTRDLRRVVAFLTDCPEPHRGTLVGLADRTIRWHGRRLAEERATVREAYAAERPTARPPIALPALPGVSFLATAGAVCDEGERMGHCIAAYVPRAIQGGCFLFHVERAGEQASVEVSDAGDVVQAGGERNRQNGAARWGARVLRTWARGFPAAAMPEPRAGDGADDCPF